MSETFVDAICRGVEVGRRLHLTEIGPTGAYLEHPVPMPVGSELRITTGEGVELGVVVVRICEQVGGTERPPGMFVRVVELPRSAETWWRENRSVDDDPAFPEPARIIPTEHRPTMRLSSDEIAKVTHEGLQRPAGLHAGESEVVGEGEVPTALDAAEPAVAVAAAEPEPEPEPDAGEATGDDGSNGAGSTLQGISAAAALAAAQDGPSVPDVRSTIRMTPDQLKSITDMADGDADVDAASGGDAEPDGDDKPKGKKRKRRRKKRKTST